VRARRSRTAPAKPAEAGEAPPTPLRAALRFLLGTLAGTLLAAPILLGGSGPESTLRLVLGLSVVVICATLTWRFGARFWEWVSALYPPA
jgi:hypothetical protein